MKKKKALGVYKVRKPRKIRGRRNAKYGVVAYGYISSERKRVKPHLVTHYRNGEYGCDCEGSMFNRQYGFCYHICLFQALEGKNYRKRKKVKRG